MKRSLVLLPLLALGLAAAPHAAQAADGGRPYHLELSGAAEVPGPGDPDGSGSADLTVNPGLGQVCYTVTVHDVAPITAAHIHVAPAGVAGPVVIPLAFFVDGTSTGCATVDRALALALVQDPGAYYLNVHNQTYPAGALRAQLG